MAAKHLVHRADFKSILPFLPPLKLQSSSNTLVWPNNKMIEILQSLSKGPSQSRVDSGERFFDTVSELRDSLALSYRNRLARGTGEGFARFFDECLSSEEKVKWFKDVVPVMAKVLLKFPYIVETHYKNSHSVFPGVADTGLRLLESQQSGVVFLARDLIAALLACSFFCLFPSANRRAKDLQGINFDTIFASIYEKNQEYQKHKIKFIMHYFERVCSKRPDGYVSFERKALSPYPTPDLWANSAVPLCRFEVHSSGSIEDHSGGSLEVDFADKYLGGRLMTYGCVQEEIRFLINPELIVGMLFLPSMSDNEAIEMVGAERFSNYTGYHTKLQYSGDYMDKREVDSVGRRKSRVIAIDALPKAGTRQYRLEFLLREANKAFCGFLDQDKSQQQILPNDVGVITGNWGCGVFGGDPEVKTVLQWLAVSQASKPFISYYTFGLEKLQNLDQVCEWILSQKWSVGDLWKRLVEYSSKRANEETKHGFFRYLNPPSEQSTSKYCK